MFKKYKYPLVIDAASTKPLGLDLLNSRSRGHCIPIDPLFVSWFAKSKKYSTDFIELARKKNLNVTNWILYNIYKIHHKIKKKKNRILIIGLAYKEDINDYRESPSLKFIEELKNKNIIIDYYDPFIPSVIINKKKFFSIKNLNNLNKYDICVLVTNHSNLPYQKILKKSKILIDTRGQYKRVNNKKIYFF